MLLDKVLLAPHVRSVNVSKAKRPLSKETAGDCASSATLSGSDVSNLRAPHNAELHAKEAKGAEPAVNDNIVAVLT